MFVVHNICLLQLLWHFLVLWKKNKFYCSMFILLWFPDLCLQPVNTINQMLFTFMLLSKATYSAFRLYIFCQYVWELNPCPFTLLTQCSTTEPQDLLVCLKNKCNFYKMSLPFLGLYLVYKTIENDQGTKPFSFSQTGWMKGHWIFSTSWHF